jgi:hypothetical protein
MFFPLKAIFRGSTMKGACFTIAIDLRIIISYTVAYYKVVKTVDV